MKINRAKKLLKSTFIQFLLSYFIYLYIKFVFKTNRWTKVNWNVIEDYWNQKKPFIACFWHNRLLLQPYFWESSIPFYMMSSGHRDGKIIAHAVNRFGIKTIWGSSSKGGTQALREMISVLKQGACIGLTPDGPRGPRFVVNEGIIQIARLAQVDIIPCGYATTRRKVWPSWDRFLLAFPFGRGAMVMGNPIKFPLTKEDGEHVRLLVEQELLRICDQADAICHHDPLR